MALHTFATVLLQDAFASQSAMLVGRMVANAEFLRALMSHGSFDEFNFFVGDQSEIPTVTKRLAEEGIPTGTDIAIHTILELPALLQNGDLSILHCTSHTDLFFDLVWLRDRYSPRNLPVTAQIHSLSYPRAMDSYLRAMFLPPAETDAIFCSSAIGRRVVEQAFERAQELASSRGPLRCQLPVVPLGVDVAELAKGRAEVFRARLGLPAGAFVVLCIARFSEYDKADLFPLLQAFQMAALAQTSDRPMYLVLAGARQGSKYPEMISLWAKALGIANVRVVTDFTRAEKADLLAAADVFVSPADNPQETFGLTVVEAMAAGLPLVVSDYDGYKETISADVGIRIPTRWHGDFAELANLAPIMYERPLHLLLAQTLEVDLEALEAAILRLYQDANAQREMARCARVRAKALYDWPVVIRKYEEKWRELSELSVEAKPPTPALHPLTFDYQKVFAHYPSLVDKTTEMVRVSANATRLRGQRYPIYPALAPVFSDADIAACLAAAQNAMTVEALALRLGAGRNVSEWKARFLIGWLLKHGLLARA